MSSSSAAPVGDVMLTAGQTALLIGVNDGIHGQNMTDFSKVLQEQTGSAGAVQIHTLSNLASVAKSSFDAVIIVDPVPLERLSLPAVLDVLKPSGTLWLKQIAVMSHDGPDAALGKIKSSFTLNGFVGASLQVSTVPVASEVREQMKSPFDCSKDLVFINARASKPSYETGDSAPIKLAAADKSAVKTAWTLSANDMVDDDILDSDAVLDVDDLKKPDPASLKASCGVDTGPAKRKACKNCTCGLAEELEVEDTKKKAASEPKSSSCGNCYLGDAFRCGSCPYRGMPAFKPGKKVALPVVSMQDDV